MSRSSNFSIGVTTLALILFAFLRHFLSYSVAWLIFGLSPFLVIWMVVRILQDTSHLAEELDEGAEWGYADRSDLRPVW
ncbi:MAG: hypothetical protein NZM43_05150 [Saprospiraceae bacterium]|nr:hypothetical protein [Saprospiraceae bacterium]MDW8483694.1 hypothetical protein [Saprospiraceae bacterium]